MFPLNYKLIQENVRLSNLIEFKIINVDSLSDVIGIAYYNLSFYVIKIINRSIRMRTGVKEIVNRTLMFEYKRRINFIFFVNSNSKGYSVM